jgi:peptide/nickel transport system permease protein
MAVNAPAAPAARSQQIQRIRRHQWWSVLASAARTPRGAIGLGLASFVVLVAIIGPFVAPNPPDALVTLAFGKPSGQFLLGGDFLGRDVLSRVLDGGWVLLIMAACATALGIVGGAAAGVSAAYLRGVSDGIIMRAVDVILSFPQLVFALLLLSLLGPKLWLITIAVGVSHAPRWPACCGRPPSTSPSGISSRRPSCRACGRPRSCVPRSCPTWSARSWSRRGYG